MISHFPLGTNGRDPNSVLPDNGFAFRINPKSPAREAVASFVQKHLDKMNDPARVSLPPLSGEDAIPHAVTFASLIGSYSSVYLLPDESTQGMAQDAQLMRHDLGIMECLEIRQRLVAELDWSIEPPDKKNAAQKTLAADLTEILKGIRRFTEYRRNMQEAIWVGRTAIQHTYGWEWCGSRQYLMPKSRHKDHPGWLPIHGDKVLFRYDDGRKMKEGAYPHQMGIRVSTAHFPETRTSERERAETTAHGMAIFLRPYERDTILVHKHMIEDADFYDVRTAGRIHGVGIRSRILKEWILKQETLAFMMQYLERSAGGIEIWEYPSGDVNAKNACIEASQKRSANGRNILYFPKPIGEDAALYEVKIVEPGFAGIDLINTLQDKYFGHRIKRYIIGQTLTTEADATGLGSGVADAHKDTLAQIILYDGANHEETLSEELVRPIQLYNFPETERWRFKLKLQYETENSEKQLEAYRSAWEMGARIKEEDVLDQVGASVPTPDDKILINPSSLPSGAPGTGGLSPFGSLPSGTSVVSAAVHQAMGHQMGGTGPMTPQPAAPGPTDGDGDGLVNEGGPNKYSRVKPAPGQKGFSWDEEDHPRAPSGESDGGQFVPKDSSRRESRSTPDGGRITSNPHAKVSSEAVEREKGRLREGKEWNRIKSGPLSGFYRYGDRPGDFGRNVRRMLTAFGDLNDEQAEQLSDFAVRQFLDSEMKHNRPKELSSEEAEELIREDLESHTESSVKLGMYPGVDRRFHLGLEALRQIPSQEDGHEILKRMDEFARNGFEESQKTSLPDSYKRRSHRLLEEAAADTHTSPTEAQQKAGNYAKGVFPWKGMEISIENPKGSERRGTSSSGREWCRTMACHYGYFRRTTAVDGDQLDVMIGSHPDSDFVLVIKQIDQETGKFDEFKVVIGCLNRKQAKRLYLANYPAGWKCGPAAGMTVELFKKWIEKGGPNKGHSIKSES